MSVFVRMCVWTYLCPFHGISFTNNNSEKMDLLFLLSPYFHDGRVHFNLSMHPFYPIFGTMRLELYFHSNVCNDKILILFCATMRKYEIQLNIVCPNTNFNLVFLLDCITLIRIRIQITKDCFKRKKMPVNEIDLLCSPETSKWNEGSCTFLLFMVIILCINAIRLWCDSYARIFYKKRFKCIETRNPLNWILR